MPEEKIEFSPIIIGTMRLGNWGSRFSLPKLGVFVDACLEMGLKDFDHADIYGHYTTEEDFGRLLHSSPYLRPKIRITTKCGIKMESNNRPNHKIKSYDSSKAHIIQSVENSLKGLQTDYIDTLLIHRPDYLMIPEEIAEAFTTLKKDGKVKFFGVSNFNTTQFDILNSYFPLVTNQIEASIKHLKPFEDGTLLHCQKNKITPTVWSPLGGGSLFRKSNDPKTRNIQKVGTEIGKKYGLKLHQVFLAWLNTHPSNIVPVIGTSQIERVKDALNVQKIKLAKEDWYKLWKASTGKEIA